MLANGTVPAFSTASSEHSIVDEQNGSFSRGNSCPTFGAIRRMSDSQLVQPQHKRRWSQVSNGYYQDMELDPLEVMFQRQELTKLRFLLQYIQHHYPSQVHEATTEYIRYRRQVQQKLELERRAYKAGIATLPANTKIHSRANSMGAQTPPRCRSPARSPCRSPLRRNVYSEDQRGTSFGAPMNVPSNMNVGVVQHPDLVPPASIQQLQLQSEPQSMDCSNRSDMYGLSRAFSQSTNFVDLPQQQQQQYPMDIQPQTQLVQDMLPDNFVEQLLNDDLDVASMQDVECNKVEPMGSQNQFFGTNPENPGRWSPSSVGSKKGV
eukprot:TRINITY_DN21693_c0_g1_i1.p1 TRINITY_DN21693_c0_g1~~TRINITY_DN21693_c0_g1_i1.p1  ORF type:complete len:364 (+),score=26.23 TRINITY_DN21693_c0_g1_i1:130-1092(+)